MIEIVSDESDASEFIAWVRAIALGALKASHCERVHMVKIDNWFGGKWLNFSGKSLGVRGLWKGELTLPPFVPNRVVCERHFVADPQSREYEVVDSAPLLHRRQWSAENFQRFVAKIAPATAIFWYSGNSERNGRGSLMAYLPTPDEHDAWYAELVRSGKWRLGRLIETTPALLASFEKAAAAGDSRENG